MKASIRNKNSVIYMWITAAEQTNFVWDRSHCQFWFIWKMRISMFCWVCGFLLSRSLTLKSDLRYSTDHVKTVHIIHIDRNITKFTISRQIEQNSVQLYVNYSNKLPFIRLVDYLSYLFNKLLFQYLYVVWCFTVVYMIKWKKMPKIQQVNETNCVKKSKLFHIKELQISPCKLRLCKL